MPASAHRGGGDWIQPTPRICPRIPIGHVKANATKPSSAPTGQNSLRTLTRQTGRRSCPLSLRQRTFSSWQILGIDGARAPDSEDIATHKDLGRIDERIDALLSQPPPGDIDEDEWRRDAIQTAFAEVKPELAEWFKEVEESNPEAMEMLNAVAEEDPPPGMDELEWAHRQFARMQQMIQSGALPIEVPRPPPPD